MANRPQETEEQPIEDMVRAARDHYHRSDLHYDGDIGVFQGPTTIGSEKGPIPERRLNPQQAVIGVSDRPTRMADSYMVLVEKDPGGRWRFKEELRHSRG